MITYLLKMMACSGLLYAFYFFFLRKEKMLVFNRFYLLGAVVVPFVIPLILFRVTIETIAAPLEAGASSYKALSPGAAKQLAFTDGLPGLVDSIVLLISLVLFLRLVYRVWQLKRKIGEQAYQPFYGARIILSGENRLPIRF